MKNTLPLSLSFFLIIFSCSSLADRENDMWQQFKAQKGMKELDAEFESPKPEPEPRVIERVVEKVIIKEVPVQAPAPQPVTIAKPAPEAVQPVQAGSSIMVENEGYIFNFGPCKLAHKNIKCPITIKNPSSDGELGLIAKSGSYVSKLFDQNGNEYYAANVTMANKNASGMVTNRYISGITVKGHIDFNNIDNSTNLISMFDLVLRNYTINKFRRIQFRNVPLYQ